MDNAAASPLAGTRALVTGGAGFVGSHLVDLLLDEGCARVVVVDDMVRYFASEGFEVAGLDFSPITGGDGNIEFLLFAHFTGVGSVDPAIDVDAVIDAAHAQLKKNA